MRPIGFGIIGGGLMGREFASAAARWLHLDGSCAGMPVIVAVADPEPAARQWFEQHVPTVELVTADHRRLLEHPGVEAVYCAVPHHLHESLYTDILRSGKHLMGEKPFGIDLAAHRNIRAEAERHPELVVRCSSEFPFFPGAQAVVRHVARGDIGEVIDVKSSFCHSSDLDRMKPINWKRTVATNGEYGVMGDLGFHVLHLPLRLGWQPESVWAVLSNIVTERPRVDGSMAPCDTWDNAVVLGRTRAGMPITFETKRIAPGETNSWSLEVTGDRGGVRWSTKQPKSLWRMTHHPGEPQAWTMEDLGSVSVYRSITGGIFEFGFADAVLQMWAAFCDELARDDRKVLFPCASLDEATRHHEVLTAALQSHLERRVVAVGDAQVG